VALAYRVEALKKAIVSGHDILVDKTAGEVDLLRREYGTPDLLPLVESLALWAREQASGGRVDNGLKALEVAERWAPGNPTILGTRVILLRMQGLRGYILALPDVMKLNRIRLDGVTHRWLWAVQHLAWLRLMVTVLLWGWALTMAMRYRCVFRHLLEEPLERRGMAPPVRAGLAALLLALPVLVGLDPSVAAMFWLWLLVPFLQGIEIPISLLVIGLQILHPALAALEPKAAQQPLPSLVALQTQPQPKLMDWARIRGLPPADLAFLQGWTQLQTQDWAGAEATFSALRDRHVDKAQVLNNLGTARFHLGRKEEAAKNFEEAFALDPESVEILVNQSILAFERLDTVTGSGKQDEGRRVDPVKFGQYMAINRAKREQRAFPTPIPDTPERMHAVDQFYGGPAREPANALSWATPGNLFAFLLPLLAAFLFYQRLKQVVRVAHAGQCVRCGEPFHTTDSPDPSVCPKCHHLFVLKDGLHQESRKKKLAEVAEYQMEQRWMHRGLIAFLPGADHCFVGETRAGFVEFLFYAFALGLVFATGRTVRYPGEILPDPASTWLPIGLFLFVLLLLRSWLKLLPRRT
jgi:tetratricopeptide (TPR) repeat protein